MEDLTYQPFCSGRMLEHLQEGIHDKLAMVPLLTLCGRNVIGILLASLKVWNKGKCGTLLKQIQIFQAKAIMHSSRKTEQQNGLDCFLLNSDQTWAKPGFGLEKFEEPAQQGWVWAREIWRDGPTRPGLGSPAQPSLLESNNKTCSFHS